MEAIQMVSACWIRHYQSLFCTFFYCILVFLMMILPSLFLVVCIIWCCFFFLPCLVSNSNRALCGSLGTPLPVEVAAPRCVRWYQMLWTFFGSSHLRTIQISCPLSTHLPISISLYRFYYWTRAVWFTSNMLTLIFFSLFFHFIIF